MSPTGGVSRRAVVAGLAAAALAGERAPGARAAELPQITLGLAGGQAVELLPSHVVAERTAAGEGLGVRIVSFPGGAPTALALAGDSIDVGVMALTTVLTMIAAGQRVRAFYVMFIQVQYEWFARPGVADWQGLRGGRIGITTLGAYTDLATRHVVRKHGLKPETDVALVAGGPQAARLAALKAGRLDAALLTPPFTWQAEEAGLKRLGTHRADIAPVWPQAVLVAKERLLVEQDLALRRLLRAHVTAVRLLRSDRADGLALFARVLKLEPADIERAYVEALPWFNERGRLPAEAMPTFWEVATAAGEVTEPWPESRFFDPRYVDSFDTWAPR